jgi:hypothetical protein
MGLLWDSLFAAQGCADFLGTLVRPANQLMDVTPHDQRRVKHYLSAAK